MSYNSINITSAASDAEVAAYNASVAGNVSVSGSTSRTPGVSVSDSGNRSYAYDASTGAVSTSSKSQTIRTGQEQHGLAHAGHVSIGGQIVSIEAAINAGLLDPSSLPSAAKAGDTVDQARYQALAQKATQRHHQGAPAASKGATGTEVAQTGDAVVDAANVTYNRLEQTLGSTGIAALEADVVQNGVIPDGLLTQGGAVGQAVQQVYDAFVRTTDATLAPFGVSSAGLGEVLDDDQLYAARKAAFSGHTEALEALGREARTRLASLPDSDPETFADLTGAYASRIGKDANGQTTIQLDGGQSISWSAAVAAGIVRL